MAEEDQALADGESRPAVLGAEAPESAWREVFRSLLTDVYTRKDLRLEVDLAAREAYDLLREQVKKALAGESFLGLPSLGGGIYGLRCVSTGDLAAKLSRGAPAHVLLPSGVLMLVCRTAEGSVSNYVSTETFQARDLPGYVRAVVFATDLQRRVAPEHAAKRRSLTRLADKVRESLA